MSNERTLDSRRIYEGKILNLRVDTVELENRQTAAREVIEHGGAAGIVALDPCGRLLMVRQYRYPIGQSLLELPAGKMDPGETPEQCARRELREETGYACANLISLGQMLPAAAYLTEVVHLFYAEGLTPVGQQLDDDEFLTVETLEWDEAIRRVLANELSDAKTQVGILKAWTMRNQNSL